MVWGSFAVILLYLIFRGNLGDLLDCRFAAEHSGRIAKLNQHATTITEHPRCCSY
jgi:hypothetical protein